MESFDQYLQRVPNDRLAARLKPIAWAITVVVIALVIVMRRLKVPLPESIDLGYLPALHALLNTLVALLLVFALVMIRRRHVVGHRRAMSGAMLLSGLFLLSYVVYHLTTKETSYGGQGPLRVVYYSLLATHICLAAISLPLILFTWIYGHTNQFVRHRRLAKWVYPVWLYVAVSGPLCYLLLRPYYS